MKNTTEYLENIKVPQNINEKKTNESKNDIGINNNEIKKEIKEEEKKENNEKENKIFQNQNKEKINDNNNEKKETNSDIIQNTQVELKETDKENEIDSNIIQDHKTEHNIELKDEIDKEIEKNNLILKEKKKEEKEEKKIEEKEEEKIEENNMEEESFEKLKKKNSNPNLTFHSNNIKDEVLIELKPVEKYLRDKIKKMEQKNVLDKVNLNLQYSFNDIRDDVLKQKLKINSSKSVNNIKENNNKKDDEKIIKNPLSLKIIHNLIKQENEIKNELYKLINNENVIRNESLFNFINTNNRLDIINYNLRLNKITGAKENLYNRLIEIEKQITNQIFLDNKNEGLIQKETQINLKNFLENLEMNQTFFNKKIFHLQEESKIRREKMERDLEKKISEKKKEIENKEKEEEKRKKKLLQQLRNNEKNNIIQRTKINNEKILKLKVHLNEKIPNVIYSYRENKKKYLENEEKLIKNETIKRKNIMKHIDLKEFSDFRKEFEQKKNKNKEEKKNKSKLLKELWIERSKLKPSYVSPFYEKYKEECENMISHEKEKFESCFQLKNIQIDYSKNKIPKVKKLIQSPKKEKSFDNGLYNKSKDYSKEIFLKMKNRFYKNKKMTKSNDLNNGLLKKKKENEECFDNKKIDYLTEMRILKKRSVLKNNSVNNSMSNNIYIEILNSKGDFHKKLNAVNSKLDSLEEKAKQKEQLLKYNGGIKNNPDLGNEICGLYLDSINAKLNIIEDIQKK